MPNSKFLIETRQKVPIYVGKHLLEEASIWETLSLGRQVFVISHPEIAAHYLPRLTQVCHKAGVEQVDSFLLASGDQHKTLKNAEIIWESLLSHYHRRDTCLIALGGGMVGDITGFCASCYLRGVRFIQVPTTLLAQVDAAIGGKTGVNHAYGKNLIGSFYQPHAIISDLTTLVTLPEREYRAGLAEIIKYGLTLDRCFYEWLTQNVSLILRRDETTIEKMVVRGCQLKGEIVAFDEKEKSNQRILLNFGHTIGHALESLLNYDAILHGEAVAIGMVVATHLSLQKNGLDSGILDSLITLLLELGLPYQLDQGITIEDLLGKIRSDKKHLHQTLQWVLLKHLGEAYITEITEQQLTQTLVSCGAKS